MLPRQAVRLHLPVTTQHHAACRKKNVPVSFVFLCYTRCEVIKRLVTQALFLRLLKTIITSMWPSKFVSRHTWHLHVSTIEKDIQEHRSHLCKKQAGVCCTYLYLSSDCPEANISSDLKLLSECHSRSMLNAFVCRNKTVLGALLSISYLQRPETAIPFGRSVRLSHLSIYSSHVVILAAYLIVFLVLYLLTGLLCMLMVEAEGHKQGRLTLTSLFSLHHICSSSLNQNQTDIFVWF